MAYLAEKRVGHLSTIGRPWLATPDPKVLRSLMRYVVAHPNEARAKGAAAREYIRSQLTWERAVDVIEQRLEALPRRPVRRFGRQGQHASQIRIEVIADRPRPPVSLCMIVKDEEHNLAACLAPVADLVHEIVVIDTGSSDHTREVAARFGARVHDAPWTDDFAAARNESLRHASGTWVFWLDADDRLDELNRECLRNLFATLKDENVAYLMRCLCRTEKTGRPSAVVDHVRLFRNHPGLHWRSRVHEQIVPALRQAGSRLLQSGVVIDHVGYHDPAVRRRKQERNLHLLNLENTERPDNPFTHFYLGWTHLQLDRPVEALLLLRRSLDLSNPRDSIVPKLYALLARGHRQLGQVEEALTACRQGLEQYPHDVEIQHSCGMLLFATGQLAEAAKYLERLLNTPAEGCFMMGTDLRLRGHATRHNLAVICRDLGRPDDAEREWKAALREEPRYGPALLGLGELYLAQGRLAELKPIIRRLDSSPEGKDHATLFQARVDILRGEFATARRLLEDVIGRKPQAVEPRIVLSQALLREGRDRPAAEQALRAVLALDPGHAPTRQRLEALLQEQPGSVVC